MGRPIPSITQQVVQYSPFETTHQHNQITHIEPSQQHSQNPSCLISTCTYNC